MLKNKTKQDNGVSPVIGVILMVAITVIIAAVVAQFVLDLGDTLGQDADATVTFDQQANFSDNGYDVSITTSSLDNADYVYVQSPDVDNGDIEDDGSSGTELEVVEKSADDDEAEETAPSDVQETVMISGGDRVSLEGLSGEEELQVIAGLDGEENQITSYTVADPQGFAD